MPDKKDWDSKDLTPEDIFNAPTKAELASGKKPEPIKTDKAAPKKDDASKSTGPKPLTQPGSLKPALPGKPPGEDKDFVTQIKESPQDEQIAYGCITLGILCIFVGLLLMVLL